LATAGTAAASRRETAAANGTVGARIGGRS
jgi:hypothetical protein